MWRILIFRKTHFSSRKCQKYAGETVFLHFLDTLSLVFLILLQKDQLAMLKIWPSPILRNFLFQPKKTEKCWKHCSSRFSLVLIVIFLCSHIKYCWKRFPIFSKKNGFSSFSRVVLNSVMNFCFVRSFVFHDLFYQCLNLLSFV